MDWTYSIRKLLTSDHSNDVLQVLEEQSSSSSTPKLTFDFSELSGSSFNPGGSSRSETPQSTDSRRPPKHSLKIGRHRLFVDGPYGTSSEKVFEFKVMILVAAGVGVTPFASILKTLAYQAKNNVRRARRPVASICSLAPFYPLVLSSRPVLSPPSAPSPRPLSRPPILCQVLSPRPAPADARPSSIMCSRPL
jgi:hypothetical protein